MAVQTKPRLKAIPALPGKMGGKFACKGCYANVGFHTCRLMPRCDENNSYIPGVLIIFKEIGRDPVKAQP